MSGIISDRCGGNPFYITAVIQQARELSMPIYDEETLNEILAVDITSGFIWGELHDQVNRWIHRINDFNITKWILYLAALDENNNLKKISSMSTKFSRRSKTMKGLILRSNKFRIFC
ncbi:MAG: hypothetical protein OMM_12955 [Candidatus Magnetoglobus multicellularis str. Araruama]|uniref:Uncharacterized protein n=1 Tax=Candidatus Magnetoglobus multicellularis str. Araruama TaxID=890399 RepID=A0A1V1NUR8_9BACT|nr:MAG: hypothetical protein OMM_12955 [Candidatus Magnetoglobus multicellularis str. Araruama]